MCQPKPISLADYSLATGERSFITTLRGSIRNQRRWGNSGLVHTWLHSFISHTLVFPFTNAVQPFAQRVSGATGSIVNIFTASKKEHRPIIFHVGLQRYIWTETGGIQKAFVFFRKSHCGALQHRKICPLPLILPPTIDSKSPPSSKSQERSIIYAVFTYWCVEYKFTPLKGSVISLIAIN